MSKDHTIIRQDSKQEAKTEKEEEKEENSGPRTEFENNDEGYQTPTSEEHKIPATVWSCPPPPPRKRKRLFLHDKKLQKLGLVERGIFANQELELFFQSFHVESRVPPGSGPSSSTGTAKKRRTDE